MISRRRYVSELEKLRKELRGKIPKKLIVEYITADGTRHTGPIDELLTTGGRFEKVVNGNTLDDLLRYLDAAAAEPDP